MRSIAPAVLTLTLLAPAIAHASDGDKALSLYLGYGTYTSADEDQEDPGSPDGAVLGLDFERGLSDAFAVRVSGGAGLYAGAEDLDYSGQLTVGITYLLDVVKYVPYVNLGVGGIVIGGGEAGTGASALLELGGGVDVLHSRSFSYGVLVRFEAFLQQTAFFTAGARATYRWDFF